MTFRLLFRPLFFLTALVVIGWASAHAAHKSSASKRKPVTVRVAMRDGMRFDPPRFKLNPGDEVIIQLENADPTHQMHNFIVAQPGKREEVVRLALTMGAQGMAKHFAPESPAVIAHSILLAPEKVQQIQFKLPDAPGVYPYICTFPGHGMVMYGAIYAGVAMPPIQEDRNLPALLKQDIICGGGQRPFVQRMFMPDASPAAIAVALEGAQNYCWDTTSCRLRYIWSGKFIDASEHWAGNGAPRAKLPAPPWWRAPQVKSPILFGSSDAAPPELRFRGYRLEDGVPVVRYRADTVEVSEKITAHVKERRVSLRYQIKGATQPVFMAISPVEGSQWSTSAGDQKNGFVRLTPAEAADFTLTISETHAR